MEKPNALQEVFIKANIGKKEIHEIEFSNGIRIIILKDKNIIEIKDENGNTLLRFNNDPEKGIIHSIDNINSATGIITIHSGLYVNIYRIYKSEDHLNSQLLRTLESTKSVQKVNPEDINPENGIIVQEYKTEEGKSNYSITYVPGKMTLKGFDEVIQWENCVTVKKDGKYLTFNSTTDTDGKLKLDLIDISDQVDFIKTDRNSVSERYTLLNVTFTNLQPPRMKSRVYKLDKNKGTYEEVK